MIADITNNIHVDLLIMTNIIDDEIFVRLQQTLITDDNVSLLYQLLQMTKCL